MNKLLSYYQRELNYIKHHGKLFAKRFPKIARRLGFIEGETEDPHVSRLIESFALVTSRIHQRLDDDIPEVITALMETMAPQFLRPLPSVCIVMISPDVIQSGITEKQVLAANTALYTRQNHPISCEFQTIYPVHLLPLTLSTATLGFDSDELSWKLQLNFKVWQGATVAGERVRLYLHGPVNAVNTIYTLLCSEIHSLILQQGSIRHRLDPKAVQPVGFDIDDGLLTRDTRIAPIHILLLDYFWFSQKFAFIDIQLPLGFSAKSDSQFEFQAVFKRNALTNKLEKLSTLIDADFFRLHCTPAINLFTRTAEPIALNEAVAEYPVVADRRYQAYIDVWAINNVMLQRKIDDKIVQSPVYPLLESQPSKDQEQASFYWQLLQRSMLDNDELDQKPFIALSAFGDGARENDGEMISLNTLCTNHSLPNQFQYSNVGGDFDLSAPIAALNITALTHPTRSIKAPASTIKSWRFYAQLSLNHQLLDGDGGVERLKETLALYNLVDNTQKAELFSLIRSLSTQPLTARLISDDPHSLARGIQVTLTFSHEALGDPEYYLLCCLLDRLFALYAPVNSFTQLTTLIEREEHTRRVWPIRAGKLSWL